MAAVDWFAHAAEIAEPAPVRRRPARSTPKRAATSARTRGASRRQRRVRAHIVWMVAFALLLAGVVAVNVAVLRAHVAVSRLDQKRAQLQARNQALAVRALERQLRAADRERRAPARPRAGVGRQHLLHRPHVAAPLKTRVVNSRLRLLLLVIFLTFAALFARAAWLQTVRASTLTSLAQKQTKFDLTLPASRGTIYDRNGVSLAIGEQATDVIADPMQISDPRHEARVAAKVLGIPLRPLYQELADREPRLRLHRAQGGPEEGGGAVEARADRLHVRVGREARLPAGNGRRAGARLRRPRQHRPRRPRAGAEQAARRNSRPGHRRARRDRPGRQHDSGAPGAQRPQRLPHARQPHPGERRAGARADRPRVAREGCDGDRARSAHGRDPRHGAGAGLQRQRVPVGRRAWARGRPCRRRRLRARLGLQGRDDRRRALAARHHAEHGVHGPRLAPGRRTG